MTRFRIIAGEQRVIVDPGKSPRSLHEISYKDWSDDLCEGKEKFSVLDNEAQVRSQNPSGLLRHKWSSSQASMDVVLNA